MPVESFISSALFAIRWLSGVCGDLAMRCVFVQWATAWEFLAECRWESRAEYC